MGALPEGQYQFFLNPLQKMWHALTKNKMLFSTVFYSCSLNAYCLNQSLKFVEKVIISK